MISCAESGFSYIDHCIEVVQSIDPEELASKKSIGLIGENIVLFSGPTTRTYSIGSTLTQNGEMHLAFKCGNHRYRVANELRDIDLILRRAPELFPKFPYFLGNLAIEGIKGSIGVITEDASKGGENLPIQTRVSHKTLEKLAQAFAEDGGLWVFEEDNLDNAAFDVAGEERLLDMYPSIFSHAFNKTHDLDGSIRAHKAAEKTTIQIPLHSLLAESIPGI